MPQAAIRIRTRSGNANMDRNMHGRDGIGKGTGALRVHGGRVDLAASLYPPAPTPWIDLSTGINPVPWPVGPIALERYQRLPLASEIAELVEAASGFYGLPAHAAMLPVLRRE